MKKILLFCTAISMLFTSCLDDNDSNISGTNQFVVVQQNSSGTKYIAVERALIQGSELNTYDAGDALVLSSYKATGNVNGQGIMNAEYINVEKPTYPNRFQETVLVQAADTTININDQVGIRNLSLIWNSVSSILSNRILVTYTINLADGEKPNLTFYYDENKQKDKQGNPLATNRAVVDIVVTVSGNGVGEKQEKVDRIVLNSTDLRTLLTPKEYPNNAGVAKIIDLRYSKYNTTTQKYTLEYSSNQFQFDYYPTSN